MGAIAIRNVCAGYGSVQVLHGLSLDVGDGETVALLGTNGNGKSTLIKLVAGLIKPASGEVTATIDGVCHDLAEYSVEQIVNLGISVVPEGRHLFPQLSVEENLLLGGSRPAVRGRVKEGLELCFEVFPRLAERRGQIAGRMSGGEQQMVALGRAIMSWPRIMLIDEPSVGLAPILVQQMIEKIAELKARRGLTVLMAEQNFTQAMRIADRGYVIVHGEIRFSGNRASLHENALVRELYMGV
ncbi:ABC transporter ATP-binding protein [Pigmentiphaga sp. NML080357]|uniref:ABC transporter ATP-binding protein n=1 Tax=Pigmentiphaga sp. NML080357 TaxID=2008675 RepID=UPI001E491B5C|nr:ABC transporter ATP-binding protein [Pigmentiphaga sp. NML080357]